MPVASVQENPESFVSFRKWPAWGSPPSRVELRSKLLPWSKTSCDYIISSVHKLLPRFILSHDFFKCHLIITILLKLMFISQNLSPTHLTSNISNLMCPTLTSDLLILPQPISLQCPHPSEWYHHSSKPTEHPIFILNSLLEYGPHFCLKCDYFTIYK